MKKIFYLLASVIVVLSCNTPKPATTPSDSDPATNRTSTSGGSDTSVIKRDSLKLQ